MGQTLSQYRAIVENMPLTQDNEEITDVHSVAIDNAEASSDYLESLKDVLGKMLVVSNEEFMNLYFQ